jgi:hypothetical protein
MQNSFQRIEMFGYPGSGKTTAMKIIQQEYPSFDIHFANFKINFFNVLSLLFFLIKKPRILVVFKLLKHVPKSMFVIYIKTIIRFIIRLMYAQNEIKVGKSIIVDEGVLQITWSLLLIPSVFSHKFDIEKELNLISKKWWPKANILILYIKLTEYEYIKRINSRDRLHFFSKAYRQKDTMFIIKGEELFERLLKLAKAKYSIKEH